MKRLMLYTAAVLATLTAALLFWEFRGALVLFLLSLAVNATVSPIAGRLAERGFPRVLALFLIYGAGLTLFILTFISIGGSLLGEIQRLADDAANAYAQIKETWPGGNGFQRMVATYLPPPERLFAEIAGDQGSLIAQAILGATVGFFDILSDVAIVLVLSIYWGADSEHFERLWLSLLPVEQRARARSTWNAIEAGVGTYIRSELVQSLLAAVMLGIGFRLIGVPYPTLLAFVGALAWLFPWVGVVLAVIPVFLVGLLASPLLGIMASLYTITVFLLLEITVEPRLFNRRRYSSILNVLMMIALADAFGIIGILIAPPLAAAIQIFFGRLLRQPAGTRVVEHADQIIDLKQRLAAVRRMIEHRGEAVTPEVHSVLERLSRLIEESMRAAQANQVESAGAQPAEQSTLRAEQRGA